jgi:adenine specific DNA methylase Mod
MPKRIPARLDRTKSYVTKYMLDGIAIIGNSKKPVRSKIKKPKTLKGRI